MTGSWSLISQPSEIKLPSFGDHEACVHSVFVQNSSVSFKAIMMLLLIMLLMMLLLMMLTSHPPRLGDSIACVQLFSMTAIQICLFLPSWSYLMIEDLHCLGSFNLNWWTMPCCVVSWLNFHHLKNIPKEHGVQRGFLISVFLLVTFSWLYNYYYHLNLINW